MRTAAEVSEQLRAAGRVTQRQPGEPAPVRPPPPRPHVCVRFRQASACYRSFTPRAAAAIHSPQALASMPSHAAVAATSAGLAGVRTRNAGPAVGLAMARTPASALGSVTSATTRSLRSMHGRPRLLQSTGSARHRRSTEPTHSAGPCSATRSASWHPLRQCPSEAGTVAAVGAGQAATRVASAPLAALPARASLMGTPRTTPLAPSPAHRDASA